VTNYSCLIVEDEPLARNLITEYVKKIPYLTLVKACGDPMEALEVLRSTSVDILFLDIQMPEITGITLLKILQKKPMVILTTAYSEYALESYELDVVDYLLKPITFDRFLKALEKINQRSSTLASSPVSSIEKSQSEAPPNFVFVKDGTKLVRVNFDDILYVEGLKDYVTIHTKQQKVISLQRLKTLEQQLPADRFVRIHHSYIIALHAVQAVHKGEVQIGAAMIPISDTYRKNFKDFIDKNQI
jgi:two-component system, LytTR family, response regulator